MGTLNTQIKSQLIMKTEMLEEMAEHAEIAEMAEGVSASSFETSSQKLSNYATPVRLIPKAKYSVKSASKTYAANNKPKQKTPSLSIK